MQFPHGAVLIEHEPAGMLLSCEKCTMSQGLNLGIKIDVPVFASVDLSVFPLP